LDIGGGGKDIKKLLSPHPNPLPQGEREKIFDITKHKRGDNMTEEKHPLRKEHLEVLLEDINGKMKLLIEGHQTLTERMDRLEESFNQKLDERTAEIRGEILGVRKELKEDIRGVREELGQKIETLDGKVSKALERLDQHEERITRIEEKIK